MMRIPLLKDNHNHFFTYSGLDKAIDLFHIKDKATALKLIAKDKSDIKVSKGWFDTYYSFLDSDFKSNTPVIIINNSIHKYFFNNAAKQLIKRTFPDWANNNDNQVWVEKNLQQIITYISGLFQFSELGLKKRFKDYLNIGVYSNSDMYISDKKALDYLSKSEYRERLDIWTDPEFYTSLNEEQKKLTKGVKVFTDGALGAYSAAIKSYKHNSNPILTYTNKSLTEKLEALLCLNTGIAIHAIGDVAIEQIINSVESLQSKIKNQIIRIEHSQFITKQQAIRAKDLGIVLCMQPNFNWDSVIYADRLSDDYCKSNNPFRMLIDEIGFVPGKDLIFGSDGMPSGIEGCIQQSLFPPVPGQKLSLDEFVAGYCINTKEPGYIQLEIDELKNKVVSEVIIP